MTGQQLHVAQRAACLVQSRAARVMNVRRPEWDEQPSRPTARYAIANQLTMLTGVIGPPRSDRMTGPVPVVILRQAAKAARRLG